MKKQTLIDAFWTIAIVAVLMTLLVMMTSCGGGSTTKPIDAVTSTQVQAQTVPSGGLHGALVLNTGPFACDNQVRHFGWWNTSGSALKVMVARQWTGFDYTLESDTHVETHVVAGNTSDLGLLVIQQLDNYKHRSFEQERWVSFAPSYVEIPAGGGLQTDVLCNKIAGAANTHVTVSIWYL